MSRAHMINSACLSQAEYMSKECMGKGRQNPLHIALRCLAIALLLSLGLGASSIYEAKRADLANEANIAAGIAFLVNGAPVTIYDMTSLATKSKEPYAKVKEILISKLLRQGELDNYNIDITKSDVERAIDEVAEKNGISRAELFATVASKNGLSIAQYRQNIKENLETKALTIKILQQNMRQSDKDRAKEYYDNNQERFNIPESFVTTRYSSKDPKLLKAILKHPKLVPSDVQRSDETIDIKSLPKQIAQVFVGIPKGSYSPILNDGKGLYTLFLIRERLNVRTIPFEQVKNYINEQLINDEQERILREHFEKLRFKANIVTIREF